MASNVRFSFIFTFLLLIGSLLTLGCEQNTHRENLAAQHAADSQAKFDDMAPAEGVFAGTMHLTGSGQEFEVVIKIQRVMENGHPTQSPDPTDTVELVKLSGNMRFPAVERLKSSEFPEFSELLNPMGGFSTAVFNFGNYDPKTHFAILPYTVPSYSQGNFGELSGQIDGDQFNGSWFSNPFGVVGKFELRKQRSS